MNKTIKRVLCLILTTIMLSVYFMTTVFSVESDAVYTDYSVSPEFAERYPAGVIRFYDSGITISEGGEATLKLIRTGGTHGKVSVEIKAIDVSAKYGVDYIVEVMHKALIQSDEYTGTLTEKYLEQIGEDYITSDTILTDEVYKEIVGYKGETAVSEDDKLLLHDASVALTADRLGISAEEAEKLVNLSEKGAESENEPDGEYKSPLHELKDSILNEKTAPNGMITSDMLGIEGLIGDNKGNLAASSLYADAKGAYLRVEFADGENEKTIVIKALKDGEYEPQEAASLGICNPKGGVELGDIVGVSVIIDSADELAPSAIGFNAKTINVSSNEAAASIEIVRTGCLNDYAEISLKTIAGSAQAGEDYLPINTTSVFYPGEERKVVIVPLKTSVCDQTKIKNLGLKLGLNAGSATLGETEAVINIMPKPASNAKPEYTVVNSSEPYIVIPLNKIKSDGDTIELFSNITDMEYSCLGCERVEIDISIKTDGNKFTRSEWKERITDKGWTIQEQHDFFNRYNSAKRNFYGLSNIDDSIHYCNYKVLFAGEKATLSLEIDNKMGGNFYELYSSKPLNEYSLSIYETTFTSNYKFLVIHCPIVQRI